MLFNSLHFLVFLPLTVILYYSLPQRFRWILIFLASCYFYMAFVPAYILILFFIILIDYTTALAMEKNEGRRKKFFLVLSLLSNILLLSFFKYFNFLNENLEMIFHLFGASYKPINLDIVLPIGLSFHTFQSMSYTIEVYRGRQKAERHLGYFANYVLFFPQMVAGPIERYEHLGEELKKPASPQYADIINGLRLILFGLFVKMTVADNIAPFVNMVFADPQKYAGTPAWLAMFLFSFQIYADFYGYSTIAVGSARLLGIHIMDNFRTPYLSASVTELWTRWHISLSTWFRDYLYIPLGGNRVSGMRWCLNIMIVFMVSGLWHGASWSFVIWGALHGGMLLFERALQKLFRPSDSLLSASRPFRILLTFVVTSFIWIFFRAKNFENAKQMIHALAAPGNLDISGSTLALLFAGILVLTDLFVYNSRFDLRLQNLPALARWLVYASLIFGLMALAGAQKFAFIYFQF